MRPTYTINPFEGARNLCLGRVLLKQNAAISDTELCVGEEFTGDDAGLGIVGTFLWYNNPLETTSKAIIVQPNAVDEPNSIEHQETITINTSKLGTKEWHLYATSGITHAYTVARGAYVRLYTLPSLCSSLKLVQQDFLALGPTQPQDRWFPAIWVFGGVVNRDDLTNTQWIDTYSIIVRYARLMGDGYDRQTIVGEMETLATLLGEDYTLGGTCYDSYLSRPMQLVPTAGRVTGPGADREVATALGTQIDWGDIYIEAKRIAITDKAATPA